VRAGRHSAAASSDPGGPEPEPGRRRQRVGPGQRPDCVHHAPPPGAGGHPREEHAPVTPPLVLLPYRLETRFGQSLGGPQLWVRIYPSQISIDGHDPRLSPEEMDAGKRYWTAV